MYYQLRQTSSCIEVSNISEQPSAYINSNTCQDPAIYDQVFLFYPILNNGYEGCYYISSYFTPNLVFTVNGTSVTNDINSKTLLDMQAWKVVMNINLTTSIIT